MLVLWTGDKLLSDLLPKMAVDPRKNPDAMDERELRSHVRDLRIAKKRLIKQHRASVKREAKLLDLIKKYIRHVGDHESVDFIEDRYRTTYRDDETFTDEQWRQLKAFSKEAWDEV